MDLQQRFVRRVLTNTQPERVEQINNACLAMSELITYITTPSREQALALTAVQEAALWTTAAIAVNE